MEPVVQNITYRPPVTGTDEDNPTFTEGGTQVGGNSTLLTADMTSQQLLEGILIELKKINLRQQEAFEETVKDEDV